MALALLGLITVPDQPSLVTPEFLIQLLRRLGLLEPPPDSNV